MTKLWRDVTILWRGVRSVGVVDLDGSFCRLYEDRLPTGYWWADEPSNAALSHPLAGQEWTEGQITDRRQRRKEAAEETGQQIEDRRGRMKRQT